MSLLKAPIELVFVEYPPVAIVVIECKIASKAYIPEKYKRVAQIRVKTE